MISAARASASLLLSATGTAWSGGRSPSVGQKLTLAANGGLEGGNGAEAMDGPKAAAATDGYFGLGNLDASQMKLKLMERVGKELGLDMHDFKDLSSYARAVKQEVSQLTPSGIAGMEARLGLDKLGVTLGDVVDAMMDPGGAADDKLTNALTDRSGEALKPKPGARTAGQPDEIGRYGQRG
jgi:hypothetical protein